MQQQGTAMADPDDFLRDEQLLDRRRLPPKRNGNGSGRWLLALVLLLAAVATGVYFGQRERAAAPPVDTPATATGEVADAAPAAARHPIEAVLPEQPVAADAAPLPPLQDSDAEALAALAALLGLEDAGALFVPSHVVPRIVATIDNLPQRRLATRVLPLHPVPGSFRVHEVDGRMLIDPANTARYERYVALLQAADTDALVAAYVRAYPLFQQAYRDLGYPEGHFNDRLVQVIDHLLEAPEAAPELEVVPYRTAWAYADPALEQASAGHRLLFRLGPENAAAVKAKLRELRAAVASTELTP